MRRVLLLLVPGLAAADTRIDVAPVPELLLLEPAYHLDRDDDDRTQSGIVSSIGVGDGVAHDQSGLVGEATIAAGLRTRRVFASTSSELVLGSGELQRGRHQGYLQLRTDHDERGGIATLGVSIEHGEARALAPAAIGPGRRDHATAFADELIAIGDDSHDLIWGVLARVDGSGTRWLDAPALDHAYRGAVAVGIAAAPIDDELPRGRLEALVTRVELGHTVRKLAAAGSASIADVKTRVLEVMSGANEITGWIDHELLVAFTARFGAKWIEVETATSSVLFAMQLGLHLKWRDGHDVRELGLAVSRDPTPSPDGQSLLSETRLQFVGAAEGRYYAVGMRGGIAWDVPQDVDGRVHTRRRYGAAFEAFVKIAYGMEVGAYHMTALEPRVAGDPFADFGSWTTEAGLLARWRPDT